MSSNNDKNNLNYNNNQDEKDRSRAIFNEVLEEFKNRHLDLYKIKDHSKLLLRNLSNFLIKIAENNCKQELKNTEKFFELQNDDLHGFFFEKNIHYENNERDANKIMNEFERCLDKQTGINKKINLFEISSEEIMWKNKYCVQNCEKKVNQLNDETLRECFFGCVNEMLDNMSNLQTEYNQDLQNIINKF